MLILLCSGLFLSCLANFVVLQLDFVAKMSLCFDLFPLCCANFIVLRLVSFVLQAAVCFLCVELI